ncbi:CLUMA_CG019961, isoform A [Clunio marinus]|uniref:CLUMA_CG019961, isoform A n=1 Tax=Clunio marinus TaxID=568069 RepID=A0A1J1J581_9DIPT|nr:CLUMA_CG019961, isoform A [Clunio marinus]
MLSIINGFVSKNETSIQKIQPNVRKENKTKNISLNANMGENESHRKVFGELLQKSKNNELMVET